MPKKSHRLCGNSTSRWSFNLSSIISQGLGDRMVKAVDIDVKPTTMTCYPSKV